MMIKTGTLGQKYLAETITIAIPDVKLDTMLNRKLLEEINERSRRRRTTPYVTAVIMAAALAIAWFSYVAAGGVLIAGAAVTFLAWRYDAGRQSSRISYRLSGAESHRFEAVVRACDALAKTQTLWEIEKPSHGSASIEDPARREVRAGNMETPGILTNIEVRGIETPQRRLLFFPECVLVYERDRYRAVSYEIFDVTYSSISVTEESGEIPADAEVARHTWRYLREDGAPDLRMSSNAEIPIVLYGQLDIDSIGGSGMRLLVSNRTAAIRFAREFGAGRRTIPQPRELDNARRILGVGHGAGQSELSTAYREKAKMYHPDRMADLSPEDRESAELKMKELNAAYTELKRHSIAQGPDT